MTTALKDDGSESGKWECVVCYSKVRGLNSQQSLATASQVRSSELKCGAMWAAECSRSVCGAQLYPGEHSEQERGHQTEWEQSQCGEYCTIQQVGKSKSIEA